MSISPHPYHGYDPNYYNKRSTDGLRTTIITIVLLLVIMVITYFINT